jgi:segregation and condensation protein A
LTAETGGTPMDNTDITPGAPDGYQVKLQVFEGPLDLLLFLIRKKKIDIHDIPIAVITREYLDYLNHKDRINLDREAEFLFMAALLIYIKSQFLLPREQPLSDEDDPRKPLMDRLLDFQRIKAACVLLKEKEDEQLQVWRRTAPPPLPAAAEDAPDLIEVSLFDLAESFFAVLKKREYDHTKVMRGKDISLEDKMKEIIAQLQEKTFIDFLEYLEAQESLEEALIAFFCLLELIKAHMVIAVQEQLFRTIKVWLRKDAPRTNVS